MTTAPRMAGQTVVITGGGAPLGLALARRFTQAGAQVVLADLDVAFIRSLAEGLQRDGLAVAFEPLEVRRPLDCLALVERVAAARGGIDVWVNGASLAQAAFAPTGPSEALGLEDWQASLEIMLSSAFYGARAVGAHMLARGRGVIVNLATVEAYQARAGHALHSAAYAGVVALTRALGVEWASRGVRVVGVAAGLPPDRDPAAAISERRIPLRRAGTPEELAEAVFFVASDEAAFIVGETLRVDGGWTAYHLF